MNKENLIKLAGFLENPQNTSGFDLHFYALRHDGGRPILPLEVSMGSHPEVACALGHATRVPGLEPQEDETWKHYSWRVFGREFFDSWLFFEREIPLWDWCFSDTWAVIDNSPEGTAARIRHLVEHDTPPVFFTVETLSRAANHRHPDPWIEFVEQYEEILGITCI